jgi:tRNA threonylcarbamoyladenosine biosynthesis protein TsaB
MNEIAMCMKRTGLCMHDIDVFAVAIGPGSFTGLRVGISTIKGFAYATGKPVTGVSTLEALAWNTPFCQHLVCPLLDARKGQVYGAVYQWNHKGFVSTMPEGVYPVRQLIQKLEQPTIFLGEGSLLYRSDIIDIAGNLAIFGTPELMAPSPAHIAQLGLKNARNGIFIDPAHLVPKYVRRSEAEKQTTA